MLVLPHQPDSPPKRAVDHETMPDLKLRVRNCISRRKRYDSPDAFQMSQTCPSCRSVGETLVSFSAEHQTTLQPDNNVRLKCPSTRSLLLGIRQTSPRPAVNSTVLCVSETRAFPFESELPSHVVSYKNDRFPPPRVCFIIFKPLSALQNQWPLSWAAHTITTPEAAYHLILRALPIP